MFNSTNTPFTMPVMPATGGYADGAGWGDGGWLWIIVVFALLFGWGNNGFGNGFGNGGGYAARIIFTIKALRVNFWLMKIRFASIPN